MIFENVWNREHIDNVQITFAERLGVEERGGYYDESGALRDMVQNHTLQLLSLLAMDKPASFTRMTFAQRKSRSSRTFTTLQTRNLKSTSSVVNIVLVKLMA